MKKQMNRRITSEQIEECKRLKAIWKKKQDECKKNGIKLTQEYAADKLGFDTQGAVSQYLNGKIALNTDTIIKFSNFLQFNPTEVRANFNERYNKYTPENKQLNINKTDETVRRIPLISWVQAGKWNEIADIQSSESCDEWIYSTSTGSNSIYALKVKGDSMTNPYGSPSIPEGYIIIIDPEKQAENGSLVVARLDDGMEATFKKLVIDGSKRYLKPLNPAYPVIEINGNCTICGVVDTVQWKP